MVYFVFDSETTGIFERNDGENPNYKEIEYFQNARLLQLSWCKIDYKLTVAKVEDHILKNEHKINNSHIHGITSEICVEKGVNFSDVITKFAEDLKDVKLLVGHNLDFDLRIVKSELYRIILENKDQELIGKCNFIIAELEKIEVFDTMLSGQLMYKFNRWPKLIILHKHIFGYEFEGAHNAVYDILATAKCFVWMVFKTDIIVPIEIILSLISIK
jgi:DNA polymerase-3 subunit alpha